MKTPVLLIIFNRPEATKKVIDAIRIVRPKKVYVAADGPRPHVESDAALSRQTRDMVRLIDWECEIKTLFQDQNLGCKQGPITAISWLFESEEHGIILEDDCLPHPSFFNFCEEMLEGYKNVPEVMHISGNNFQDGKMRGTGSYYFSKYTHNWGWATWRRAWQNFQPALDGFNEFDSAHKIKEVPISKAARRFWMKNFRYTMKRDDSWDSLWMYSVWRAGGLSIIPNRNLVTNIGFGTDATHTVEIDRKNMLPAEDIGTLAHPDGIVLDKDADEYTFNRNFKRTLAQRIIGKFKSLTKK